MPRSHRKAVEPVLAKAICENLELGMPLTLAAEAEGVARRTVYEWVEHIPAFAAQVTRARAIGARRLAAQALEGGKGSAMAGWMLERRYHDDYGPPRNADKTAPSEVRIVIEGGLPKSPQ